MPITKAAKKKLRQDEKRHRNNRIARDAVLDTVKKFKKNKSEKLLSETFSVIDRAKKKGLFHSNKVARMKSSLAKFMGSKEKPAEKKATKKKAPTKKK